MSNQKWTMKEEQVLINKLDPILLVRFIASLDLRVNWGQLKAEDVKAYAVTRLAKTIAKEKTKGV